jgi:D-alanyl-D-alanine carboxypeptidase (penicillin-binding protein 5/6)
MTLLLVMKAIEDGKLRLDDMLTCSDRAASMGGSQIYLEEGEQMTVEELIKCVVISSANDAALMLAEAVAGSEEVFVDMMNRCARELGMKNTNFENTNGLDDTVTNHVTSARDVAIMSRELIKYDKILEYSKIWMDTTRNGTFGLTNTNRLVRFYKGATGLKTGSTSKAKFCVSATAMRDGMHLICVIMAADTRDIRNAAATTLLDWGFANYALYVFEEADTGELKVTGGVEDSVSLKARRFCCVVPKGSESKVERFVEVRETTSAPVKEGEVVGSIKFNIGNETIGTTDIVTATRVDKIGFWQVFTRIFSYFLIA